MSIRLHWPFRKPNRTTRFKPNNSSFNFFLHNIVRERYSFLLFNQMINISRIPSIQRHLRINGPKVMSLAEEWVINRSLDKCNCSRNKQRLECESAVEKSHCASVRGHLPFSETDYCI